MTLPIGPFTVAASAASPTGISWIDVDHGYTGKARLVTDECAQLCKGPTAESVSCFAATSRDLPANILQILQGDSSPRAFGGFDDLLTDDVVFVATEARLFVGDLLQLLLGSFSVPALQPLALQVVLATNVLYGLARVAFSVACGGKLDNTEIDADEIGDRDRRTVGDHNGYQQEPFSIFAENQIGLLLGVTETIPLVLAHNEWDKNATYKNLKADCGNAFEGSTSEIVGDCRTGTKDGPNRLVAFVRFADAMDTEDCQLSGKTESLTNFMVKKPLCFDLVREGSVKESPGNPIGSLVESLHCASQGNNGMLVRLQM